MIEFPSGAKRDEVKPRYDLIESCALRRLAERCTLGAKKYGDYNWQKGLPPSDVFNHVIDHLLLYREKLGVPDGLHAIEGLKSDDDLAGAMWGIMVLMWQQEQGQAEVAKPTVEEIIRKATAKIREEDRARAASGPVPHVHTWKYAGISPSWLATIYSCACGMLKDQYANGSIREYMRPVPDVSPTQTDQPGPTTPPMPAVSGPVAQYLEPPLVYTEGVGSSSYDDRRLKATLQACPGCKKEFYFVPGHDLCRDCWIETQRKTQP